MNAPERATLRDLFNELNYLSDRINLRFDGMDERMRSLEEEMAANRAVDAVRKEHKVGLRWGISTILSIVGISATVGSIVTGIVLRVMG